MKNLNDLTNEEVDLALNSKGYLIVKDPEVLELASSSKKEYLDYFKTATTHPCAEKFTYSKLCSNGTWTKAAISSSNGVGEAYAQLLTTTYFAPNNIAFPSLQKLFSKIIRFRNRVMGVSPDFGLNPLRDKFWNALRIHHYPIGGGFMVEHKDSYFPVQLGDKPFYQIGVLLSKKGVDFQNGGGFIIERDNKTKIDLEIAGGFGSVVIFDGKTPHGVLDVDTHELLDLRSSKGRLAAFANVYNYNE